MPGLAATESALTVVATQLRASRDAVRPEDSVAAVALDALLDGGVLPDDLATRVLQIRRDNEIRMATAQILGPVEERLKERLAVLHRTQADDGLRLLAVELDVILSEARPVLAELHGVDDAAGAIDADRVQPWREAIALAERHVALRGAQRVITSASLDPPDRARATTRVAPEVRDMVNNYGIVRDAARHYPELGGSDVNRSELRTGEVRIFSGRLITDSHTDRPVRVRPWLTGDAVADLHFLVTPGVAPWVPSIAALAGARDEHERHQQDEARAAAERRPGDDDPPFPRRGSRQMPPPSAALLDRLAREELGEPA